MIVTDSQRCITRRIHVEVKILADARWVALGVALGLVSARAKSDVRVPLEWGQPTVQTRKNRPIGPENDLHPICWTC